MLERWEHCEATVVAWQERPVQPGVEPDYDVVLEVRPAGTAAVRLTVDAGAAAAADSGEAPMVGDVIGVMYDPQTQEVTFSDDPDPHADSDSDVVAARSAEVLATHTPPGGISADPGERLAKLMALREQGFLSDDDYQTQRQRLIDTI